MIPGKYKPLFTPLKIGKMKVKNRIAMSPMGIFGLVTDDGCFTPRAADYYLERAKGGAGLLITGLAKVENDIEQYKLGLVPHTHVNPYRFIETAFEMTEAIHAYDTKILLQLGIGFGRVGHPTKLQGHPVAPSPIPNYWDPDIICRELTLTEIEHMVEKAAEAAVIAKEAGFDGVDIHAVHEGYLLDQFAIAFFNQRTDKYGGDLKGRLAFATEIVEEIKKKAGQDFPVTLRFSIKSYIKDWRQGAVPGEDFQEKGRDIPEAIEAIKIFEEAGYDALSVDAGTYDSWYWAHPPGYQAHGCALDLAEIVKPHSTIPIIAAGRMDLPDLALGAVRDNKADMVAVGRGLLADPYWPLKLAEGKTDDIRPCIGCHEGCMWRGYSGKPLSCAVNPACGREKDYALSPTKDPKMVTIVGGGLAGMEAARVAALRGHKVKLYEKTKNFGGHLIDASTPSFKDDEKRLLSWYTREIKKAGVEVNIGAEFDSSQLCAEKPDVVIIATGSEPIIPPIAGIDQDNVATASDLLLGRNKAGRQVVIIGGGQVGCEVALWLAQGGREITIVEMAAELMRAGAVVPHMNRMMLLDLLQFHQVQAITEACVKEIKDGSVLIERDASTVEVEADTVVIATGYRPQQDLYKELIDKVPRLYLVGDARKPRNIMYSIWDAYEIARSL